MSAGQSQRAGDNSRQVQVHGDYIVYEGITEEKAVEISRASAKAVLAEHFDEAKVIGEARIEEFGTRLIEKLEDNETLGVLRDPGFQVLLRKAQLSAASSGRESDYDLLSGLLADRAERAGDRKVSAAVDRAVQVVDLLADDALAGLTVTVALIQYYPISGPLANALNTLQRLFLQLPLDSLSVETDWVDHLDALGLVRESSSFSTKNPALEIWLAKMPGYVSQGVADAEAEAALERHVAAAPRFPFPLTAHPLKPGFQYLPVGNSRAFVESLRSQAAATDEEWSALEQSLKENYQTDTRDPTLDSAFLEELAKRPNLSRVRSWWDAVPSVFNPTAVGRVLARANAERLDVARILPPLT